MNQTERLDFAKFYSLCSSFLAIAAFFSSLGVLISLLSIWVEWWVYMIIAAIAVASFLIGYHARRVLRDFGVYQHSPFYQGLAVISLGCSPITLFLLVGLFALALASVR